MKADKIHISQFDFLSIEKLEIDSKVGEHTSACLRGAVRDEDVEEYRRLLSERTWVKITAEDEDGTMRILLNGIIAGFSLEKLQHEYVLEIILKSGTCLMDARKHFRSFQNQAFTYLDVMKIINQSYQESGVEVEKSVDTAVDFLLQYQETDWEFIKRIASHFGLPVTPDNTRKGVFYRVGNIYHVSRKLSNTAGYCISREINAFMLNGTNETVSFREHDYMEYQISTREIYGLWDALIFVNHQGYIRCIHSEYRHGELVNDYTICPAEGMGVNRIFNDCQQGCSFMAEVKAVMQDKVQVTLVDDENKGQTSGRWFPYSTGYSSVDGAGWYCMPEMGDKVRLQIPDHMEEHGYVISAVHNPAESGHKIPDHKSFKTRYGKELLFTPDRIELTNNQGMSIRMIDGEGIQIVSDKNIAITAGGSMTISSQNASLVIAGTESVDVRQGEAGLHMDNDITFTGGKFRIQ